MKGIRQLLGLVYWVDNQNESTLEVSMRSERPVSKQREAIKQSLKKVSRPPNLESD